MGSEFETNFCARHAIAMANFLRIICYRVSALTKVCLFRENKLFCCVIARFRMRKLRTQQ